MLCKVLFIEKKGPKYSLPRTHSRFHTHNTRPLIVLQHVFDGTVGGNIPGSVSRSILAVPVGLEVQEQGHRLPVPRV